MPTWPPTAAGAYLQAVALLAEAARPCADTTLIDIEQLAAPDRQS